MQIKLPKKGYTDCRNVYKHTVIELNPGVTVLIGCNGSGKTTLLNEVDTYCKSSHIPVLLYDNLDVSKNELNAAFYNDDLAYASDLMLSSEGESISVRLSHEAANIGYFVKQGAKKRSNLELAFMEMAGRKLEDTPTITTRVLLFDAVDSGLSIDQVDDMKKYFFDVIVNTYTDDLYILVTANEYEMCVGYPCFNVTEGKYVTINSYEDYKREILNTREYKEKQLAKLKASEVKQ